MRSKYKEIEDHICKKYENHYLKTRLSSALSEDIKDLTLNDVIALLEEIKTNSVFFETTLALSRKSDLFDKLVLMKGRGTQEWVLRLHTYNMVKQSDEPGYVISNLNRKIRDDENHIHEHSWQLTSRVLLGGLKNHQYTKTEGAPLFNRYNLVPTAKDGVSGERFSRQATFESQDGILEIATDLYQQGDLVHYPIEIPHKVDTEASAYLGMTITLAHTSERHHENSIFYEDAAHSLDHENKTLDVEAKKYTEIELLEAIELAITTLKLCHLSDTLAQAGFNRFNRFSDPLSGKHSPNNVLETELLPTIAMLKLQKENFIEHPMTEELKSRSADDILEIKRKNSDDSVLLSHIIKNAVQEMDETSLEKLINHTQHNLFSGMYTAYLDRLKPESQEILAKREKTVPTHVLNSWGLFSYTPKKSSEHISDDELSPIPLKKVLSEPKSIFSKAQKNSHSELMMHRVLSGDKLNHRSKTTY